MYARGNHETRGAYARNFSRYFAGSNGKFYYAFTYGPVRFIVLDCGEDKPDTDVEYSGLIDFDSYMLEQKDWRSREIDNPEFKNASYRVVISHIPFTKGGWYGSERLREQLLPLLEQAQIDLMLSGHKHSFEFSDKGNAASFPIIVNSNNSMEVLRKLVNMSLCRLMWLHMSPQKSTMSKSCGGAIPSSFFCNSLFPCMSLTITIDRVSRWLSRVVKVNGFFQMSVDTTEPITGR